MERRLHWHHPTQILQENDDDNKKRQEDPEEHKFIRTKRVTAQTLQDEDDDNDIWDAKTLKSTSLSGQVSKLLLETLEEEDNEKEEMNMQQ